MATTTNYGWTTPDDTALVKDGAAAIRTLGSSVDTTTKNLNPSTTLGDIEYRSSTANTNTRLAIGTSGQLLTVSGGVPAWTTVSGGGMTLLSTTTLSGSTTTISSISQSYKDLRILVIDVVSSNQSEIAGLRLNGVTASDYAYEAYPGYSSASNTVIYYGLTTTSSDWDKSHSGEILIHRYAETEEKFISFISYANAGSIQSRIGVGRFNSTTAISSITLTAGAGTFSSGTVYIYGVN
jgi:hypothetical protein